MLNREAICTAQGESKADSPWGRHIDKFVNFLAEKIGADEALMSKILHYQIEEFTIDRLVKFLTVLYPNAEVKIAIAS